MKTHTRLARFTGLAASLAAVALIAGCGDDDSSSGEEKEQEAAISASEAIVEVGQVRAGLAAGLAAYKSDEADKADDLIADAYLEHYELVEAPLEERDEELNEELEELISMEIRDEIKQGAKPQQVEALVAEADERLTEAEKVLKG